jgi:septal ring factor EnvC (AmiA/AmiB activator)
MKKTMKHPKALLLTVFSFLLASQSAIAQYTPEVMDTATLGEQLTYVQERTRIYDGFRAIREDIFQKMKKNSLDSLNGAKLEIATQNSELTERNVEIETLNADLGRVKNERDQAIRTKDSFTLLGIEMNKGVYSTVLWIIILVLALFGVAMFLLFKRAHVVTSQTNKELESLKEEYESHKKNSREKYEKLVVTHHNEIMKLKRS